MAPDESTDGESTLREAFQKYDDAPPFVIQKAKLQRWTIAYAERVLAAASNEYVRVHAKGIYSSILRMGAPSRLRVSGAMQPFARMLRVAFP